MQKRHILQKLYLLSFFQKADNSKEMFRVSYKVFDFSHQFGKLNGYSTVQVNIGLDKLNFSA